MPEERGRTDRRWTTADYERAAKQTLKLKEQEERCERLEEALRAEILAWRENAAWRRDVSIERKRASEGEEDLRRATEADNVADRLEAVLDQARTALQHSPEDEGADS